MYMATARSQHFLKLLELYFHALDLCRCNVHCKCYVNTVQPVAFFAEVKENNPMRIVLYPVRICQKSLIQPCTFTVMLHQVIT